MTHLASSRASRFRTWLIWTAGFIAFPLAGLAGTGVAGRVDGPVAALVGGAVAGLVIGAGQTLASRGRLDLRKWVPATAVGMGLGLLLGAVTVGYRTSLADLALMGALTGLVLGPAQALALPRGTNMRWVWAAAMPALWALGWTTTTLGGIAVDEQFTVFGAYGAVTFSALSGLLLLLLLPDHPSAVPLTDPRSSTTRKVPMPTTELDNLRGPPAATGGGTVPRARMLDGRARGTLVVSVFPSAAQTPSSGRPA